MIPYHLPRYRWPDTRAVLRRLLNSLSADDALSSDDEERLVHNMTELIGGLAKIARRSEHIELWIAPEESAAAGSFHLYPRGERRTRFVIEERYVHGDRTDPDRRAIAWDWRTDRLARRRDGTSRWEAAEGGQVESDDVAQLLKRTGIWARRVNQTAQWTQTLGRAPKTTRPASPDLGSP